MNEVAKEVLKKGVTKNGIKSIPKALKNLASMRAPEIAIATGAVGLIAAGGLAIRATIKAVRICDADTKERKARVDDGEIDLKVDRTLSETAKLVWKDYIPAAVTAAASTTSIVLGIKGELGRSAAYAAALTMAEESYSKYKESVEESLGEKKRKEIDSKFADKTVNNGAPLPAEVVEDARRAGTTGGGETLVYFPLIGKYARVDIVDIYRACTGVNQTLGYGESVSLAEYLDELGISDVPDIAAAIIYDANNGMLDIKASETRLSSIGGEPCLVVELRQKHGGPYAIDPRVLLD